MPNLDDYVEDPYSGELLKKSDLTLPQLFRVYRLLSIGTAVGVFTASFFGTQLLLTAFYG